MARENVRLEKSTHQTKRLLWQNVEVEGKWGGKRWRLMTEVESLDGLCKVTTDFGTLYPQSNDASANDDVDTPSPYNGLYPVAFCQVSNSRCSCVSIA